MNDFIKLTLISGEYICIKKENIIRFQEDLLDNEKHTTVSLSEDESRFIRVKETLDEIMEMLNYLY